MKPKTIAETLSQAMYKRSADPKHPENALDADWQAGYFFGRVNDEHHELHEDAHPITIEWRRRGEPDGSNQPFKNWKMGYHAGTLTKIDRKNHSEAA